MNLERSEDGPLTDTELITATLSGDHKAFQMLLERYESRVAATVFGMVGHSDVAEDIGQETFIRFYKSLSDFQGKSSIGTYLTRIAVNLSLNELKRRKRRSIYSFFQSDEPGEEYPGNSLPDPRATAEYDDTADLVHRALQQLDPKFRSVVVLRLLEGCSTRETAEILQLPTGTVLSRLARAQEKLKDILTPYMGEYYEPINS